MKKILAIALVLMMVLGMVACADTGSGELKVSVFWYDEADVYLSSVRAELNAELEKAGIAQDAWEAIKAGFSDYKLNFTETKAEKEISKEEMMNLLNFLMSCGADEKTAGRFLDKAVPMWAEYRLALAAKNEKAQLTKEDTAMVDSLVKSMGLREDAADVLYKKLFNYKRFFNRWCWFTSRFSG